MTRSQIAAQLSLVALFLALAGCAFLPTAGPYQRHVRAERASADSLPYALVKVTPDVLRVLATAAPRLAGAFPDNAPPRGIVFGIGDVVSVTIFESKAGGLYIPAEASVRPGNFITLPNQLVDNNGNISVPYAGSIPTAGHSPRQVQDVIVERIRNRAIEPQAVVALVNQQTSLYSVLGEVNTPGRFPALHEGERLLDAIARGGGPKGEGFDTWVMLERDGRRGIVPFGALVYEPSNNIYAHPNDTIYLYQDPQTFVAFGATGEQGQYKFSSWRISMAEAMGKARGLLDANADPDAVFLYRGEIREVAARLGVDVSKFDTPIIPIIYNLNLRDPSGYFLATKFEMRNKDVIYVANAPGVEIAKFLLYLQLITKTVADPISAVGEYYDILLDKHLIDTPDAVVGVGVNTGGGTTGP
jgi:polysaccharide export outer membrane protein